MAGTPNRHHDTGARIRRLRLSTGLSQERFAPRIGITRRHLIRLENGEHAPLRSLAARIEGVVEELTGEPPAERVLDEDDEDDHVSEFGLAMQTMFDRAVERAVEKALRHKPTVDPVNV